MQEVGRIIGRTSLREYMFAVSRDGEHLVKKDDFVSAVEPITKKEVVGVVKGLMASNQLLPDEFARESTQLEEFINMYDFGEGEYLAAIVEVLGYLDGNELRLPKYSLRPASPVTMTPDATLKQLMQTDKAGSIHIGTLDTRPEVDVYLDVNKLVGMHCTILAVTGAGKSYTAGVLVEELLKKGGAILIFDPHGEYKYLGYTSDGSKSDIFDNVKVFGIGDRAENPLKVKADKLNPEDIASMLPGITETQKGVLYDLVEVCRDFNKTYTLQDLIETLQRILEYKEGNNDFWENGMDGKLKKAADKAHPATVNALIRRLSSLKRTGLVSNEETGLEEIVAPKQATVIDLSGVTESIRETVVGAIARKILYARMNYINDYDDEVLETPCLIMVEEAHNFAPRSSENERPVVSRSILRRIAREGRKFGVGLCIISQRPSRLDQDVLSQCNTQIIMRIVNPIDQAYIRDSAEAVTEGIIGDLPSLGRGEAIITGSAINFPVRVKIKRRDTKPGGSDINIISEWKKLGRIKSI